MPPVNDLPTRPQNGWCICTHPVDHHSNSNGRCLMDCSCEWPDVLMTRQEFIASLTDCPTLDMGDDNRWVMVDLGPWDDAIEEDTE